MSKSRSPSTSNNGAKMSFTDNDTPSTRSLHYKNPEIRIFDLEKNYTYDDEYTNDDFRSPPPGKAVFSGTTTTPESPLISWAKGATSSWQHRFPSFHSFSAPGLSRKLRLRRGLVLIFAIFTFVILLFKSVPLVRSRLSTVPGVLRDHGFYEFDEREKKVSDRVLAQALHRFNIGEAPDSQNPNTWTELLGYASHGYGANKIPEMLDLVYMRDMDAKYLPQKEVPAAAEQRKRLIFIGDVHGSFDPLNQLLASIQFNAATDHLVFTGGIIGGAPYSSSIINLARQNNASCVRGLVEDRVLLTRQRLKAMGAMLEGELHNGLAPPKLYVENQPADAFEAEELALARTLTDSEAAWLESCPLILRVGDIKLDRESEAGHDRIERKPNTADHESLVVVHAGLVPGLPLNHQDPLTLMSVKSIGLKTRVPSNVLAGGVRWSRVSSFNLLLVFRQRFHAHSRLFYLFVQLYNREQQLLASRRTDMTQSALSQTRVPTTVVHGHDLTKKPFLTSYTKGLNTGCYRGGALSAMVVKDGWTSQIVGVKCPDDYAKW